MEQKNKAIGMSIKERLVPSRQFCAICGHIHKIDFSVPNEIWAEAIHPYYHNSIVCLNCFMERADEKFLQWEKDIKLWPCSFHTQRQIQVDVTNSLKNSEE